MRGLRWAALAATLACAALAPVPPRVEYTFEPVLQDGALRAVQVDIDFRGDADGETDLRLPNEWGGKTELYRSVEGLTVVSGATLQETDSPARRVLTHRPGARIHLRYRIIQDWQGEPNAEQGNTYRATIQPTYFHFIGDAALIFPEVGEGAPVRVRTRNFPRGWSFASDLEHPRLTLGRANASVTVGGDFRIVRGADPNIRLAIRGQWSFTDEAFAQQVSEIIAGQRRFWGDESTPYLVTVLQLTIPQAGWLSVGGTGLEDAFAFFATPNAEGAVVARTLAHESMHTWIPGRIGRMPQEGEAINYWLSEGFTDFFTSRVLVRDGVWTPTAYAEELNRVLGEYARSPVRTEPNTRILADYWSNRDVQRLPYQRGQLLAILWDARLRAAGRDFDDVVMEMRERVRRSDTGLVSDIFPAVAQSLGLDVGPDLATYVDQGAAIVLPENVLAPCGRIVTREVPVFHRGFDIDATTANNRIITGVDPALPAYAAGLRDGMELVRRESGEIGNAELEIAYVVRDHGAERTLRYMPRGHGSFTLQQLELAQPLEGEALAQCTRVLSGA